MVCRARYECGTRHSQARRFPRVIASAASNLASRFTALEMISTGDYWLLKLSRFARHDREADGVRSEI